MKEDKTLRVAIFNPRVTTYWLMNGAIVLAITLIGIPLLIFWFLLGQFFTARYLNSMSCELTERVLKVKKGIWVRTEKTIPLEKITDLGMVQGPLMRRFGVERLSIETAGQSGPGALVALTGIQNAQEFREVVLAQRDLLAERQKQQLSSDSATSAGSAALLVEIRDVLLRVEHLLQQDRNG